MNLKKSVTAYNKQLWLLGIRDHQVEHAKSSFLHVFLALFYRLGKLAVLAIGTLPGLILFAPVFVASKIISVRKSREALAASTVKLQGRDVMATWKLLVAMALAPSLYAFYTVTLTYWVHYDRVRGFVPEWLPLWTIPLPAIIFFLSITFAALRFGEIGMDIIKSLRPLVLSLNPSSANTLVKLRKHREILAHEVSDVINTFGPALYPDFDATRIVADPFRAESLEAEETTSAGPLPHNESFHEDLGSIGLFASRPPSRSRSRHGSRGASISDDSTVDTNLDEVSRRIRGAMRERRKRSEFGGPDLSMTESGQETPEQEPRKMQ